MPNENLSAALRASLEMTQSDQDHPDSPLRLADENSIDILLDRINSAMAEGLPEKITDEDLRRAIDAYRAQAYKWEQQEQQKAEKSRGSGRRSHKEVVEGLEL